MNETCKTLQPLLVDYSDGELAAAQAAAVAAHLAECATCRVEVRLLADSLSFAREVWQGEILPLPMAEGRGTRGERSERHSRRKAILAAGIALCASILLAAVGFSFYSRGAQPTTAQKTNHLPKPDTNLAGPAAAPHQPKAAAPEIDPLEYIAREGRAARLAASMQMLAAEPSLKSYKDNAERYLRENYADTTAVRMLGQ
jgi:anti-sigma factor RsiW